jgi:hypothetical protein
MMIAEEYLGRSRLFRRLKNGPHGQLIELYAARVVNDGLARQGAWRCLSLVGALLSWISESRSKLHDLDERMVERFLLVPRQSGSESPSIRIRIRDRDVPIVFRLIVAGKR